MKAFICHGYEVFINIPLLRLIVIRFLNVILSLGDSKTASFSPTTLYLDMVLINSSFCSSTFRNISLPYKILSQISIKGMMYL